MNHLHEESTAGPATHHARRISDVWDEAPPQESAAVLDCQNCGHSSTRITWIPEYEVEMCDTCRDDALVALHKEPIEPVCPARLELANDSASVNEFRLALRAHAMVCATCGASRKTAVDERLALNQAAICCEGKVA